MSRKEAEKILRENKEHGNMLIRRRETKSDKDPWIFAVSVMRQYVEHNIIIK